VTQNPSWLKVAVRPQWILALLLSLAIGAGFALLGQWQLGRAFESNHAIKVDNPAAVDINTLMTPAESLRTGVIDRKVSAKLMLDQSAIFIIENRIQLDGRHGYWIAAAMHDAKGNRLFAVLGFAADRKVADRVQYELATNPRAMAYLPFAGVLGASEESLEPLRGRTAKTLSIPQLINSWGAKAEPTYPAFLIADQQHTATELEPITMRSVTPAEVNWLNAFYAIEWVLFAGFALFLWWRLVRDAQLRELEESAD
jgi:cytochrome oxidase assembly protein ShyY1